MTMTETTQGSAYGAEYDALEDIARTTRRRMRQIEEAARAEQSRALVGRAFRYRNCYSMPENDADYWWMYSLVVGVSDVGGLLVVRFQQDRDGKLEVERCAAYESTLGEEISRDCFTAAWRSVSAQAIGTVAGALVNTPEVRDDA